MRPLIIGKDQMGLHVRDKDMTQALKLENGFKNLAVRCVDIIAKNIKVITTNSCNKVGCAISLYV